MALIGHSHDWNYTCSSKNEKKMVLLLLLLYLIETIYLVHI